MPSPRIVAVAITYSENRAVRALVGRTFASLAAADRALADAFAAAPPTEGADKTDFRVTWDDGAEHVGTMDVTHERVAASVTGLLYGHLRRYHTIVHAPGYVQIAHALGLDLAARRAWADELMRRLDAEHPRNVVDRHRNAPWRATPAAAAAAGAVPHVVAVEITFSENAAVTRASYPSIWAADAALAAAFRREPPPPGGAYDKTAFVVRWSDGETHEGRADVSEHAVAAAPARGGLLRAHLADHARWLSSDDFRRMYTGHRDGEVVAADQAWGRELARRLAADLASHADPRAPRNRTTAAPPRARRPRQVSR